jgi:DNA-binding transcriptional ArsR family regulator
MVSNNSLAEIAALIGDPARAGMLHALMDGRALTASELAQVAGITPQTASGHLARLTGAGLLTAQKQGRHRYHRLASINIANMIEGIMQVASTDLKPRGKPVRTGPRDQAMLTARTCYDHLAGKLGVAITDALVERSHVEFADDGGAMTESGLAFLGTLGIDLSAARGKTTRVFCRPCLDWSERRPHVAGHVGAAICAHCFSAGWLRRIEGSRAVAITPRGQIGLRKVFEIELR